MASDSHGLMDDLFPADAHCTKDNSMSKTPGMMSPLAHVEETTASHNADGPGGRIVVVASIKKLDLRAERAEGPPKNTSSSSHRSAHPPLFVTTIKAFPLIIPAVRAKHQYPVGQQRWNRLRDLQ